MDVIRSEAGQPLREELAKSPEKIIATITVQSSLPGPPEDSSLTGPPNPSDNSGLAPGADGFASKQASGNNSAETPELQFQGIALISALVKLLPDWLYNNRPVFDALIQVWHSPARLARLQNEQNLSLNQVNCLSKRTICLVSDFLHNTS
jgi:transformation/transcription domain-associated protein